ncbi:type IV secretory system conjugative DNA transfer family protein [Novispirillum itersonii]|uniref:Type IV secretion system protein VirD4 n=1 Tax=Novispirillum itersonii TaxID=189 RepID=A0A7W9ZJ75_NOVIT|nr:type IV secretory system conjugative DNA transfer family protein [Novispirillum itersonii]MBB6212496.1 type IV secretion system protein VirD4 [Novispirillum itersonii]
MMALSERLLERLLLAGAALLALGCLWGLWWWQIGFDPRDVQWWKWLIASLLHPAGLPQPMVWAAQGCLIGGLVLLLAIALIMRQARNRTLHGAFGSKDLHGSARWATFKDVKHSRLLSKKAQTGAVVGGWKQGKTHHQLRHIGPEHVMCFAPTRSGKGVSLILPTLLSWQDSVIVLDIKGENHALTAGWRASLGHRILKFDPTSTEGCSRYNPLAEIRIGSGRDIADCQNIASIIVDPDGKGLSDHWMKEGWSWLTTSILHVVYRVHLTDKRRANLADVRRFLSKVPPLPVNTGEEDLAALFSADFEKLLKEMATFKHGDPVIDDAVRTGIGGMLKKVHTERSGVHSSAVNGLGLWADPIIAANTGASDWTVEDLMNGDDPAALYLMVPPSDIARTRPLMRIVLTQIIGRQTEKMEFKGGKSVKSYRHRLLLMLDEFPAIGKIDVLQKGITFVAGYGLKLFLIIQNTGQLEAVYGKNNGFMANCNVRIAFAPNEGADSDAEMVSKLVGKTTIVQSRRSASDGKGGRMSDSLQETGRALLTPDEAGRLRAIQENDDGTVTPGEVLTLLTGRPPIRGTQYLYFQDKTLLERAQMPAPAAPPFKPLALPKEEPHAHSPDRPLPHRGRPSARPTGPRPGGPRPGQPAGHRLAGRPDAVADAAPRPASGGSGGPDRPGGDGDRGPGPVVRRADPGGRPHQPAGRRPG